MGKAEKLLLPAFLAAFFISYLGPITEGDFFHHLSAGEAVWKTRTSAGGFPAQWLGQLLLYAVWSVSGYAGIVILRAAAYTSILTLLALWMRNSGIRLYYNIFFLLMPAHLFLSFPSERPQIFGFALFAVVVFLLDSGKRPALYAIPPILFLWAFVHPSFLLGILAVWAYFLASAVSSFKERKDAGGLVPLAISALLPVVALALVPGSVRFAHDALMSFLNPAPYMKSVQEYLSPITAALDFSEYYPAFWLLLLAAAYSLIRGFRSMPLSRIALILIFAALPFKGLRFMPYLAMLAPVIAGGASASGKDTGEEGGRLFTAGFALVLVLWVAFVPQRIKLGLNDSFPEKAAAFLNGLPDGRIFNYQGWAGYLKWIAPEKEIFIPVADVPSDVDTAYGEIIWAESAPVFGRPHWQGLLEAYKLDVIIMPGMSPITGQTYPLTDAIQTDREWFLVYSDDTANILLRSTPAYAETIRLYSLPKANIFLQIIAQAKRQLRDEPRKKALWRALGDAYLKTGRKKEAEESFKKAD